MKESLKRSRHRQLSERVIELESELRFARGDDKEPPLHASTLGIPDLDMLLDVSIANKIIVHSGNVHQTLWSLGYPVKDMSSELQQEAMRTLLTRPGVRDLLTNGLKAMNEVKDKIIARHIAIAATGAEAAALASATFLAKLGGWFAPSRVNISGKLEHHNVFEMLHNPEFTAALDKLTHEPGAAVAVEALPPPVTYEQGAG